MSKEDQVTKCIRETNEQMHLDGQMQRHIWMNIDHTVFLRGG